ncbi:MAG: transposase [Clostridia bacterium]|nr:transposase [Clostridia bacterium]
MGLRTIVLKLHKPSAGKEKILDRAMLNYNLAFDYLLKEASGSIGEILPDTPGNRTKYNAMTLSKWVRGDLNERLNQYSVQPFKDSLKLDIGMTLASYLKLKEIKPEIGFPGGSGLLEMEAIPGNTDLHAVLNRFEKLRPIYFCRYDLKRSYCLLYDPEKKRYYAKLYLMNGSTARSVSGHQRESGPLTYVHKDKGMLEKRRKKEAFILVPLSFGKSQEKVLTEALERPESLRTAKLIRKNGEYYLAVSVDIGEAESIITDTFIGVSRGLKHPLNYSVVNGAGEVMDSGAINLNNHMDPPSRIPLNALHETANEIVRIAFEKKAQVIMQNLAEKGDRISWMDQDQINHQPVFKCHDYNRLADLLEYKLPGKGLPPPVRVSSVDVFYTCPRCGLNSRKNRFTRDIFICTLCGMSMEVENLGSMNIARKLISYNSSSIRIKVAKTPEGVQFTNGILGLELFSPYTENQLEKLKNEIKRIVENVENTVNNSRGKELARKISIVKKLSSSENFMDLIEYI